MKILAGKEGEKRIEVLQDDTYENVLEKLGINPVDVLVLRGGKPVPEDETVAVDKNKNKISIVILRIVSGW